MILTRVSLVAVLAIVTLDQATALTCHVCTSTENSDCLDNPKKIEPTQCKAAPSETSTPTPGETVPTEAPTAPDDGDTEIPNVTSAGDSEASILAADGNVDDTSNKESEEPSSEKESESNKEAQEAASGNSQNVIPRFRRNVFLRDEASFVCFKLVYKAGDTDVVERGCAPKQDDACDKLKVPEAKTEADCYTCDDKDGCNASSRISLGLTSILVPSALLLIVRR